MSPAPPGDGGLLLVDKPSGPTTYDLIRWIKRSVKGVKIGHCGTLDPLATGLVVILFGKATRLQSRFMGQDKTYWGRIRFGVRTDTGDIQGAVLEAVPDLKIPRPKVEAALAGLIGVRSQRPPMYSAVKHQGVPLYKFARQGETIERKARDITVHSAALGSDRDEHEYEFRFHVSSGTYIRVLVEDIGAALGVPATTAAIRRESIGGLGVESAIPGEQLLEMSPDDLIRAIQSPMLYVGS